MDSRQSHDNGVQVSLCWRSPKFGPEHGVLLVSSIAWDRSGRSMDDVDNSLKS
ncbi:MAG: hypothetical protein RLZ37_568, partial [Actinomycetota bacterium]